VSLPSIADLGVTSVSCVVFRRQFQRYDVKGRLGIHSEFERGIPRGLPDVATKLSMVSPRVFVSSTAPLLRLFLFRHSTGGTMSVSLREACRSHLRGNIFTNARRLRLQKERCTANGGADALCNDLAYRHAAGNDTPLARETRTLAWTLARFRAENLGGHGLWLRPTIC